MKKYLFIIGLVGTALFTACSTADDLAAEKPIETPSDDQDQASVTTLIAEARQDSEVPITLGFGQNRGYTRTPIDPTSVDSETGYGTISLAAGQYLRVFCLASGPQSNVTNIPEDIRSNNWASDTDGSKGGLLVKMNDVPAKVSLDNVSFLDEDDLPDTETKKFYYYPMGNWMKYNFYGYYPKLVVAEHPELSQTTEITANTVEVSNYLIDGSQDLIWGRAHPELEDEEDPKLVDPEVASDADPYCAKYIRLKRNEPASEDVYLPNLKFKHQFVQFNFFVKAATNPLDPDDHTILRSLRSMHATVTDMYIDNAIYKLKFNVAKQVDDFDNYTDCQLTKDGDDFTTLLGIKKWGSNSNRFDGDEENYLEIKTDENSTEKKKGQGYAGYIMLPSPEVSGDNNFMYRLIVRIKHDGNPDGELVGINLVPPTDGFVAGNSYNVFVRIQSPERISAKAVLHEWETYTHEVDDGEGGTVEVDYIEYNND